MKGIVKAEGDEIGKWSLMIVVVRYVEGSVWSKGQENDVVME